MSTETTLSWKRSEHWGQYADSPTEALRYYVHREGKRWTFEAFTTIEVAGIRTVKPGTRAVAVDQFNDTAKLAKGIAAAYEAEPERDPERPYLRRLTRAIERAYEEAKQENLRAVQKRLEETA
jgi:hypothetical protein